MSCHCQVAYDIIDYRSLNLKLELGLGKIISIPYSSRKSD